jgi:hypothetical protein
MLCPSHPRRHYSALVLLSAVWALLSVFLRLLRACLLRIVRCCAPFRWVPGSLGLPGGLLFPSDFNLPIKPQPQA